ncbi:unnamed protein product [Amoebophrya sp. A25]|nr:unnamed protein product [Amoebophrya sp. A25]|eukprot:GSA25T00013953001.1
MLNSSVAIRRLAPLAAAWLCLIPGPSINFVSAVRMVGSRLDDVDGPGLRHSLIAADASDSEPDTDVGTGDGDEERAAAGLICRAENIQELLTRFVDWAYNRMHEYSTKAHGEQQLQHAQVLEGLATQVNKDAVLKNLKLALEDMPEGVADHQYSIFVIEDITLDRRHASLTDVGRRNVDTYGEILEGFYRVLANAMPKSQASTASDTGEVVDSASASSTAEAAHPRAASSAGSGAVRPSSSATLEQDYGAAPDKVKTYLEEMRLAVDELRQHRENGDGRPDAAWVKIMNKILKITGDPDRTSQRAVRNSFTAQDLHDAERREVRCPRIFANCVIGSMLAASAAAYLHSTVNYQCWPHGCAGYPHAASSLSQSASSWGASNRGNRNFLAREHQRPGREATGSRAAEYEKLMKAELQKSDGHSPPLWMTKTIVENTGAAQKTTTKPWK